MDTTLSLLFALLGLLMAWICITLRTAVLQLAQRGHLGAQQVPASLKKYLTAPYKLLPRLLVGMWVGYWVGLCIMGASLAYASIGWKSGIGIIAILGAFLLWFGLTTLTKGRSLTHPLGMARALAWPGLIIHSLCYPLTFIVRRLKRRLDSKPSNEDLTDTNALVLAQDHPLPLTTRSAHLLPQPQEGENYSKQLYKNAIAFGEVKVRECMVPRTEVVSVESKASLAQVSQKCIASGHSRLLVYEETIDNVIGYVHAVDLFDESHTLLAPLVRPMIAVPEYALASDVLRKLVEAGPNLALVVDESGGTSGIVTVEDIIETITGDIEDEHDHESFVERKVDNAWLFSARLSVSYINDTYGLDLPESEEFETLGGLILATYQNVPVTGTRIPIGGMYIAQVLRMIGNRIGVVRLEPDPSIAKVKDE